MDLLVLRGGHGSSHEHLRTRRGEEIGGKLNSEEKSERW